MSSGSSSSASLTSCSKAAAPSSVTNSVIREHVTPPQGLFQRLGHRRVVYRGVLGAELLLCRNLRLLERRPLARLELHSGVQEQAVGDAGQVGRAGRVAL